MIQTTLINGKNYITAQFEEYKDILTPNGRLRYWINDKGEWIDDPLDFADDYIAIKRQEFINKEILKSYSQADESKLINLSIQAIINQEAIPQAYLEYRQKVNDIKALYTMDKVRGMLNNG